MPRLTLNLFVQGERDLEATQYRIQGALQHVRRAFDNNFIYPHLPRLMELHAALRHVLDQSRHLSQAQPRRIKSIDPENKTVEYEPLPVPSDRTLIFEDLIRWALPRIQALIAEGETLCEFFDQHVVVKQVGILPQYTDEGYLLIPDDACRLLHVIQYRMSIFTGPDEHYRSLKTTTVKTLNQGLLESSPHRIKLDLLEEFTELPNPATFMFSTDLDVPYRQTLLPIAKRKLMRHIATC